MLTYKVSDSLLDILSDKLQAAAPLTTNITIANGASGTADHITHMRLFKPANPLLN